MREVSTCDFCGEEAAGTYEVVPSERDPAGEGRRLVLCPDCRDTLWTALEPLVERSADPDAVPAETGTGTTTVVAEPGSGPDEAATDPADAGSDSGPDESLGRKLETGGDPSGDDADEGDRDVAGDGRQGSTRRGAPPGYRKVMRFLENREFPVDREEAETLAAEAYEMDPEAVSAAVDHAVKHDRLREVSGDLHQ